MSFSLILLQRKILLLISQNFVTLKEYFLLYAVKLTMLYQACLVWETCDVKEVEAASVLL